MLSPEVEELAEIVRIPSPAPAPQAVAFDGEHLWVGSWETEHVYGIDAHQGRVFEDAAAPGKPVGATVAGDELFFVLSEAGDSRFIRRFVPGHGFKMKNGQQCPDDTGSFLAFDGSRLWLSQRHNKRVLKLSPSGGVERSFEIGHEIIGLSWVDERLYLSLWLGATNGGCRIAYIEPAKTAAESEPAVRYVAQSPFAAISLTRDGDRFWTSDYRANALVAFTIPR